MSMEELEEKESPRPTFEVIHQKPSLVDLSQYEEAAVRSGYELTVIAQAGETYTTWVPKVGDSGRQTGDWIEASIVVEPERVAIAIERPRHQRDHAPFWRVFEALTPKEYRKTSVFEK